jgi:hypothetical protein
LDGKWHNICHKMPKMNLSNPLAKKLIELGVYKYDLDVYGIRYELDDSAAQVLSRHCDLEYYEDALKENRKNIILDYNDHDGHSLYPNTLR